MKKIVFKKVRLVESVRGLDQMSEEEFDTLIDSVLSRVEKVKKVEYSSDLETRVKEIQADAGNALKNRELDAEDNKILAPERAERKEKKRQEHEKNKYNPSNFKGLDAFKFNFYNAIKDQVNEMEDDEETWSAIDRRFEDDKSIVVRGKEVVDKYEDLPSIDIFIDQSGSWTEADLKIGATAVAAVREFELRGEIKLNLWFFSNHVHETPDAARAEGGTDAWLEILQTLKGNGTKNAVIITDSDMGWDARRLPGLVLDGAVWYIWKRGKNAQSLPEKLWGRRGTFQYAFDN